MPPVTGGIVASWPTGRDQPESDQPVAPGLVRGNARRAGEDPASGGEEKLGQGVDVGEPGLDGDELKARILLEADEVEPGVELTRGGIDAVGKAVAATEDGLAVVGDR